MSETKEIIQLASMLSKAIILLLAESDNKDFHLRALEKPRSDLSPDFQEFLIAKVKREQADIQAFCCRADKLLDVAPCNAQELSDIQKRAMTLILENDKVCKNVAALADKMVQLA